MGTRIAVAITLGVLLNNGLNRNAAVDDFISTALQDSDALLVNEVKAIQ